MLSEPPDRQPGHIPVDFNNSAVLSKPASGKFEEKHVDIAITTSLVSLKEKESPRLKASIIHWIRGLDQINPAIPRELHDLYAAIEASNTNERP